MPPKPKDNNEADPSLLPPKSDEKPAEPPKQEGEGEKPAEPPKQEGDEKTDELFKDYMKEGGEFDVDKLKGDFKTLKEKEAEFIKDQAPEKYELVIPESINKELIKDDDPLVTEIWKVGKEVGISQEKMNKLTETFLGVYSGVVEDHKKVELEALGKEGPEIVERVGKFFSQHLQGEDFEEFRRMATTAGSIKVLDSIRKIALKTGKIPDVPPSVEDNLSEDQLRAIMKQDAYHNPKHPEYNKLRGQVTEGFKKLYPDKAQA